MVLCDRVIVIQKGKKFHDGSIDRLDATGSRTMIVRIVPTAGGWPETWRPSCGTFERRPDGVIVIHVPSENVVACFREALDAGAVADITIQEVPLEDIISDLFTRAG
jgi:ABC-2 type transport system ATP-binding protein